MVRAAGPVYSGRDVQLCGGDGRGDARPVYGRGVSGGGGDVLITAEHHLYKHRHTCVQVL